VFFEDLKIGYEEAMVVQENHYDPYGLNLASIEKQGAPDDHFQYNGKEKQEDFGLNWSDYGARMYDSQLGRWHAVDPLAEKFTDVTPYNYVLNNPIKLIDPDGKAPCPKCPPGYAADVDGTKATVKTISNYINKANGRAQQTIRLEEQLTGKQTSGYNKFIHYAASYVNSFGGYSDANDITVLTKGRNLDGSKANTLDYVAAGVGSLVPFMSGGAIKGTLEGALDGLKSHERKIINDYLSEGSNVKIIQPDGINKVPDIEVDGLVIEMKTLMNNNANTAITRIQDGFQKKGVQSVVLDTRGTGMTLEQAQSVAERAAGTYKDKQLPGGLEIWIDNGKVKF
jgi:RHS repeat-associated protein